METTFFNPNRVFDYISKQAGVPNSGINQDFAEAVANRELELVDSEIYIRKDIASASGIHDLIESSTDQAVGTTNLQGAKLANGSYFFIESIRIAFAASQSDPDGNLAYSTDRTLYKAALYNANMILSQRGKVLIERPVALFTSEDTPSQPGLAHDVAVKLNRMRHLVPEQPITWQLQFPPSATVAGANCVEIFLIGAKTQVKG